MECCEAGSMGKVWLVGAGPSDAGLLTVRGFAAATERPDYSLVRAVCIGKQTQAAAGELV